MLKITLTCLLPITIALVSVPNPSQAQEYPGCWAINQAGEFVDLNDVCLQQRGENSGSVDSSNSVVNSGSVVNAVNSPENSTQNVSHQNVTPSPKKGRCQYPDQTDARGRLCGDRASTKRPGGNGL